jgi:hypothetical protein
VVGVAGPGGWDDLAADAGGAAQGHADAAGELDGAAVEDAGWSGDRVRMVATGGAGVIGADGVEGELIP